MQSSTKHHLVAFFTTALLMTGCSPQGEPRVASTPGKPILGGTVIVQEQQEPDALNKAISSMMASTNVLTALQGGLVTYDDKLNYIPDLAEEVPTLANGGVQVNGEKMVVTYKLRKGLRWHDGHPLTAEDVAFTQAVYMNPKVKVISREGYNKVSRVEIVDPLTVRIHFNQRFAPYVEMYDKLLPKHLLANSPDLNKDPFNRAPVGAGPFKFESWKSGDSITLVANPDYWRGKPKIDRIIYKFVPDENSAFVQLKSGGLHVYQHAAITQYKALSRLPGVTIYETPAATYEHIDMNLEKPYFQDKRVRKAIAHAINKPEISTYIFKGLWQEAWSDKSPLNYHYNPAVENLYPYDPELAKRLLDEAGWKVGSDGVRAKDGQRFSVKISTTAGRKPRELTELLVQHYLKQVGIEVTIDNYPGAILFGPHPDGHLRGGKFDMALYAWVSPVDPNNLNLWHSGSIPPNGQNSVRWRNPEMDEMLEAGLVALDREERRRIYQRAQAILAEDVPMIPLLWWTNLDVASSKLLNFKPSGSANGNFWNAHEWQLTE
jgi:peptide/nickel transport system substrate-binding protein